jgi:hypothetical protein
MYVCIDNIDPTIPLSLMEDIFDCHTVEQIDIYFDYMKSRFSRIIKDMVPSKGKGLVLLRLCNELLRKVSKVKNSAFCGEILTFIANAFSLNERSGVNLRGAFNTDNVTMYTESSELGEEYRCELDKDDGIDKFIGKLAFLFLEYESYSLLDCMNPSEGK